MVRSQIIRHEVPKKEISQIHNLRFRQNQIIMSNSLSLIDVRELARLGLLADHRYAIWVALSDAVSLVFTLLYRSVNEGSSRTEIGVSLLVGTFHVRF